MRDCIPLRGWLCKSALDLAWAASADGQEGQGSALDPPGAAPQTRIRVLALGRVPRHVRAMEFQPGRRYRMPVGFGPAASPRQLPDGGRVADPVSRIDIAQVSFLTEAAPLQALLPPGFTVEGEPVVTVEAMSFSNLAWLAGRGYRTLGVRFVARFDGIADHAVGPFLAVLWENLADPIITGREELGFAKLFCDITHRGDAPDRASYAASWDHHCFLDLTLTDLVPAAAPPPAPHVDGMLHYKYIPRTGRIGVADVAVATLTPAMPPRRVLDCRTGAGAARFIASTWEQLPTLSHIVNPLAALPVFAPRGAVALAVMGDVEVAGQRELR